MTTAGFGGDRLELLGRLLDERQMPQQRPAIRPCHLDRQELPLSPAQQRIWFFHQLDPASVLYCMAGTARLTGRLDTAVLRRCLDEVVRRHEVLRTTIHDGVAGPHATVRPPRPVAMPVIDLSGEPAPRRQAEVARWRRDQASQPFDLTSDQLLRALLLRTGPDERLLIVSLHHIAADGWSLEVLVRELAVLYEAFCAGRPSPLPELRLQYADFTAWQLQYLGSQEYTRALGYWQQRLTGAPQVELPASRARNLERTFAGESLPVTLPAGLGQAVARLAQDEGATTYMVMLAAFATVLGWWSGQEDVVVGAPIANRDRAETEELIGFFVNTLPIRLDLSGHPDFRTLVRRARTACLDAYAHQDVPFERMVEAVHPDREATAHTPLVRHTLVLHNTQPARIQLPGLSLEMLPMHTDTAKFDLQIELTPVSAGVMTGVAEFSTGLHDGPAISRLLDGLTALLRDGAAEPGQPVDRLRTIDGTERRRLAGELSAVAAARPPGRPVQADMARQAERRPGAPAVISAGDSLSYRALNDYASRLAGYLAGAGIGADDLVAICLPRSAESIVAMLGVLRAGAAYVPLDPAHPPARLIETIADCAPVLVLTAEGACPAEVREAAGLPVVDADQWLAPGTGGAADGPALPTGPHHAAYVIYTSGSTGQPKGAVNEHGALANRIRWMQDAFSLRDDDAVLHKTPLGFDVSVWEWVWPLATGARVVVAGPQTYRDPAQLAALITAERVTVCHFVPSMLRAFLAEPAAARCAAVLRLVVCSGEELPPALAREFRRMLPGVELANLYGPAEAAIDVTAWPVPADDPLEAARVPIGRPIGGVSVQVLDRLMRPVPDGVPGEIYIGGLAVGRGYRNRPGLTAERFVPDPFIAGGRLYRTGDRARKRADGVIEFLGRTDHQVKIRGQRIEPAEVEAVLAGHPLVSGALVTAVAQPGGDVRLVGYVTLRREPAQAAEGSAADHLGRWGQVFDETFRHDRRAAHPADDFSGWNSSYTGEMLPDEQMRDWADRTAARIAALRPRRVVEIGCGVGLLLFRLAPRCESYLGTDLSGDALARVSDHLGGLRDRVRLEQRPADDFGDWPPGSADTVILNSVIQYFPSLSYLTRVIEQAVRLLAPGGNLFIGDVRDYRLLPALHYSVLMHRLPADTDAATLARMAARRAAAEDELAVAPAYFAAAAAGLPAVDGVSVLVKEGAYQNELTKYRYDVVLHLAGQASQRPPALPPALPPAQTAGSRPMLSAGARPRPFLLAGLRDRRVLGDLAAVAAMNSAAPAGRPATVAELARRAAAGGPADGGSDPDDLGRWAAAAGYVMYPLSGAQPGTFDAACYPAASAGGPPSLPLTAGSLAEPEAGYANEPMRAVRDQLAVLTLRAHLHARLPGYMVPSALIPLQEWPLGLNGKVDRRALPPAEELTAVLATAFVPPRTSTEHTITRIWRELLGVDRIGVNDNFFDLGGHSLLATQLTARIQRDLLVALPLGEVFRTPSVACLAESVDQLAAAGTAVPIRRAERRRRGQAEQNPAERDRRNGELT